MVLALIESSILKAKPTRLASGFGFGNSVGSLAARQKHPRNWSTTTTAATTTILAAGDHEFLV
ncbi:MAG TPA: hypothetical protein VI685_05300 [Candidatus Angelobacter sp.]